MTSSRRTALVIGATGMVGRAILDELLQNADFSEVIAVTRRPLVKEARGYTNVVVDFERLDNLGSQIRGDDIFCALGTTIRHAGSKQAFRHVDFDLPLDFAKIGLANGARSFNLVSAVGADAKSSVFYLRVKGELELALAEMPFAAKCFFRPAMLEGDREKRRLREEMGIIFSHLISFLLIGRWRKYRSVKATVVARAMIAVALRGEPGTHIFESDEIQSIANSAN